MKTFKQFLVESKIPAFYDDNQKTHYWDISSRWEVEQHIERYENPTLDLRYYYNPIWVTLDANGMGANASPNNKGKIVITYQIGARGNKATKTVNSLSDVRRFLDKIELETQNNIQKFLNSFPEVIVVDGVHWRQETQNNAMTYTTKNLSRYTDVVAYFDDIFDVLFGRTYGDAHVVRVDISGKTLIKSKWKSKSDVERLLKDTTKKLKMNESIIKESRLDSSRRQKANALLRKAGFDGNGRFQSLSKAISQIDTLLKPHNLRIGLVTMDLFIGSKGNRRVDVMSNDETEYTNTMLVIAWEKLASGFEIVAYLS